MSGPEVPELPYGEWVLDPHCVEQWPGAGSADYHPLCCRFPKSCSAWQRRPANEGSER